MTKITCPKCDGKSYTKWVRAGDGAPSANMTFSHIPYLSVLRGMSGGRSSTFFWWNKVQIRLVNKPVLTRSECSGHFSKFEWFWHRISRTFSPARLRSMKLILEELERINERLSGTQERNEAEGPQSNLSSGSSAGTVRSGQKLSKMSMSLHFSRWSLKRWKRAPLSVQTTWKAYTGIAARGYVHRLVNHGEGRYSDGKGNHINGMEGFWAYLKRKLPSKGGITRARLPPYIAEYVWRYNHRSDPERVKIQKIIQLLEKP